MTARYPRVILGTCCLPWRDDGTLDAPLFQRSIRNLVARGLRDLYVFGTAGEGHTVTEADFRDFMFVNPVRFWGEANPKFFNDTKVEKEAAALLAEPSSETHAAR